MGIEELPGNFPEVPGTEISEVEMELTAEQLGEKWNITGRMVNSCRKRAEMATGAKLGRKEGKTTYFSVEEQDLIKAARYSVPLTSPTTQGVEETVQQTASASRQEVRNEQGQYFDGLATVSTDLHQQGVLAGLQLSQIYTQGVGQGLAIGLTAASKSVQNLVQQYAGLTNAALLEPLTFAPSDQLVLEACYEEHVEALGSFWV